MIPPLPTTKWQAILAELQRRVDPRSFEKWFRPTKQEGARPGIIVVKIPDPLFRRRLMTTYVDLIEFGMAQLQFTDTQVEFICESEHLPVQKPQKPITEEENPLNIPPELMREAEAIFVALAANSRILTLGRKYGLRFGISRLGAALLADKYGDAGKLAAANLVELDYLA